MDDKQPYFFCGIGGYQLPLTKDQTQMLYKNKKDYQNKVEQRTNQFEARIDR